MSSDHAFHDSTGVVEDARLTELQNHIDQLTRELYEEKESLVDLRQDHEIAVEQVKTLKMERENLQKSVYALEDALSEEKEKAKKERENYTAAQMPRQLSQNSLMDEERTLAWTAQIEERDRTIADQKKKIEEVAKQAAEARTLRDELDILREKALLATGLEDKLKKAMQKADQVNDLRKQIKILEDQNDQYLKQALDAEETARSATSLKAHLETYKQQALTLKTEHAQMEVATRTQQSEIERMKSELNSLTLENSGLKFRVDSLQAEVNDLNSSAHALHDGDSSFESGTSLGESLTPQLKERLALLERENQRLRERNSVEVEHKISELTHQLEDANKLNEMLKKELEKGGGGGAGVSVAAQAEIDSLKEQLNKLSEENNVILQQNLAEINNLLKDKQELLQFKNSSEHITEKLKSAAEKVAALSAEKTKHEGFLRAAKSIISEQREQIKQLQEKGSEKLKKDLEDTVQSYRNQLKEKDQQIEMITKLWEEGKENSAREQRLMTSAFYDMGLELHRLRQAKNNPSPSSPSPSPSTPTSSTPRSLLGSLRQNRE